MSSEGTALPQVNARQMAALKELGEPYHYRVNWRPKLSYADYDALKAAGLIEEAWTWASTTRPDIAITDLGDQVRRTPALEPTP